jgi:hypothetical protein
LKPGQLEVELNGSRLEQAAQCVANRNVEFGPVEHAIAWLYLELCYSKRAMHTVHRRRRLSCGEWFRPRKDMGHLKGKRHSTMSTALLIMPLVLDIAIGEVVNTM